MKDCMGKWLIPLLVLVMAIGASALADDNYVYYSPTVYQMNGEYLDVETASSSMAIEDSDTIRYTAVSVTLKNNTSKDIEFINATLLVADKEEMDRLSHLPKQQYDMEMLRRRYKLGEWYVRTEYYGAEKKYSRVLKSGETEAINFYIEERIYPSDIEDVFCLVQVYAMSM